MDNNTVNILRSMYTRTTFDAILILSNWLGCALLIMHANHRGSSASIGRSR